MQDTAPEGPEIIIISMNQSYWLANGLVHLDAILMGGQPYPTPIRCVAFANLLHLQSYIPEGTGNLWAIHPDIIARLRRDGEIVDEIAP
ncbi:MAG TPA: hypothetical protein VFR34_01335 [Paracoccaceae bacterium]|nr:hypothetical protein [Paracoccaceae bacterium]